MMKKIIFNHEGKQYDLRFHNGNVLTTDLAKLVWTDKNHIQNFRRRRTEYCDLPGNTDGNLYRCSAMADDICCQLASITYYFEIWCKKNDKSAANAYDRFFKTSLWEKIQTVYETFEIQKEHEEMTQSLYSLANRYAFLTNKDEFLQNNSILVEVCESLRKMHEKMMPILPSLAAQTVQRPQPEEKNGNDAQNSQTNSDSIKTNVESEKEEGERDDNIDTNTLQIEKKRKL